MKAIRFALAAVLAFVVLQASEGRAADPRHVLVSFEQLDTGVTDPTVIAAASDGSGKIYIGLQAGTIRLRLPKGLASKPYLDITSRVKSGGEQGLLGIAFHPRYYQNGTFYVSYTDSQGDLRVSRFHTNPGSWTAPASSETNLLDIPHRSAANHNGGQLAFGKDGYLYVGTGDGGGGGDPDGNAQNLHALLGKILRLDINRWCGGLHYCVPSSNPFASSSSYRKEIFLWGLRNPWKFSFDLTNGPIWIADVGQSDREEIDTLSAGAGGKNMGWDCREGTLNTVSTYGGSYCSGKTFTGPIYEYDHSNNRCAIIGGFVYRGHTYASVMGGIYIYGDYCTGEVWGIARQPDGRLVNALVHDHNQMITTFGQTPNGELYVADSTGVLYHLTASSR